MHRLISKEIRAEDDEVVRLSEVLTDLYPSLCRTGSDSDRKLFKENYPTVDDLLYHMLYKTYQDRIDKIKEKFDSIGGKTHLWIGINPPPEKYTMKELYNKMLDVSSRQKIKFFREKFIWCVEQHTKSGIRPHIHLMLMDARVKPSRVIETLAKAFDVSKNSIECKRHFNNHLLQEHILYIKGEKVTDKQSDVALDICSRLDLEIPDYLGEI